MSHRMQITLTDEQFALLEECANRSRISIAEHIRTLIDREFRPDRRPGRLGLAFLVSRRPDEPFVARRPGVKFVD
jgi:hypothetical protein